MRKRTAAVVLLAVIAVAAGAWLHRARTAAPPAAPSAQIPAGPSPAPTATSAPTPAPRPQLVAEPTPASASRQVRVAGRAFDGDQGSGVAGVRVTCGLSAALSDNQGFVELSVGEAGGALPPVQVAAPPGWIPAATGIEGTLLQDLRADGDDARLFVELQRAPTASGALRLADGSPASGASIEISATRRVEAPDGLRTIASTHALEAAADGSFAASLYPQARNRIVVRHGNALAAQTVVAHAAPSAHAIDFRLQEGAFVSGRVESPWGSPVGGIALAIVADDGNGSAQTVEAVSGIEGDFAAGPLLPGHVEITASIPASLSLFASEPTTLRLAEGERRDGVVVQLAAGDFVDGIVVDEEGRPVEGASIVPRFSNVRSATALGESVASGVDGRFRVMGLMPGMPLASLEVSHPGFVPETRRNLAMLDGEQRIVLRRASAATLRATWAEDGSPVPYYAWRLLRIGADGDDRDTGRHMQEVESPDGTTVLETLAPGKYRAEVAVLGPDGAPSDLRESAAFEVKTPGEAVAVEVAVRGGAFVEGIVVRVPEGTPVEDAVVEFLPPRRDADAEAAPDAFRIAATTTDAAGRFEFAGVPSGHYALVARAGELRMAGPAEDLAVGGSDPAPLRIDVAPGAVVKGTVRGRDGSPLAGVRMFHAERAAGGDGLAERETLTDRDGFYSFTGLAPGMHTVRAWQRRLAVNDRRELDLAAGEERVLDFDFAGLVTLTGRVTIGGEAPGTRAPSVYLAAADGARSPLFDIAPDGAYRVETPPGVFNIVLRSDGTSGEGEQVVVPAAPELQTRDFDIGAAPAEIMVFFPDGAPFAAGTVTIAPRTMAARAPTIRLRMDGERRHVPSLMEGEYLATFASDDGAWRGDSDWISVQRGADIAFAIEARPAAGDSVAGAWMREDVTLAWRTWSWDVSQAVERPGLFEVSVRHERGRDGIVVDRATLFVNGRPVAEDAHRAWTGDDGHLGNAFRLRAPERPAGAVVTVELRIKGDGGTDSGGEVRVGRR